MMMGIKPRRAAGMGRTRRPGHPRLVVQWVLSPHPSPLPWGKYVFSVGSRESGVQPVVARASRPCVGCTIRTGGTPVPLRWKRRGRRNSLCLSMCQACEWLNTYWGEGESFSARRTIRTRRLSNARCAPFPLPEGPERECVRVRGNGAAYHPLYRTIPGNVDLGESSGRARDFPKCP